jgi:hypothetical protein
MQAGDLADLAASPGTSPAQSERGEKKPKSAVSRLCPPLGTTVSLAEGRALLGT